MKMIIIFVFAAVVVSCSEMFGTESTEEDDPIREQAAPNAMLLGPDDAACACCVGMLVAVDDDTLRFTEVDSAWNLVLPPELPAEIYLEYEKKDSSCLDDEIEVLFIEIL